MSTYALRGVLPSGGSVQHPIPGDTEPSIGDAKARCSRLVALLPDDTTWLIVSDERQPDPKRASNG